MDSTDTGPRIGSLFSGYGGLDMGVQSALGGHVVWHSQYEPPDKNGKPDPQYAAQILHHHWPDTPNLGDITAVDWHTVLDEHGPMDILTGGFPCQDVSLAGVRRGLAAGNRSGLWFHMASAISILKPRLVVIENVRGLLSADAHGHVESCTWCLGDGRDEPVLRALGAVLGDLAGLGLDAEWQVLRASDVDAPHRRERVIVLGWPAAEDPDIAAGGQWWLAAPGQAEGRGPRADAGGRGGAPAADADRDALRQQPVPVGRGRGEAIAGLPGTGTAPHSGGGGQRTAERGLFPGESDADRRAPADADSRGFAGQPERDSEPQGAEADDVHHIPDAVRRDAPAWGQYGHAIARWEQALGRPAPWAVDDRGRLSPEFVEWLMGLPAGHVTAVPGIPRNAQLKALGNGVVPQQADAALRLLLGRIHHDLPAALATA